MNLNLPQVPLLGCTDASAVVNQYICYDKQTITSIKKEYIKLTTSNTLHSALSSDLTAH